jgi:hypothetical protein
MHVLWLSPVLPFPPHTGGRVYSLGLIRALAPHVSSIAVVGLAPSLAAGLHPPCIPGVEWTGLRAPFQWQGSALMSPLPFVAARHSPRIVIDYVRSELRRKDYDLVVFDQYASGWALDGLADCLPPSTRLVYIAHNYETAVAATTASTYRGNPLKRLLLKRNARKIALLEERLIRGVHTVFAITDEDRALLHALGSRRAPVVLRPGLPRLPTRTHRLLQSWPRRVILLGSFQWTPKQLNLIRFLNEAQSQLEGSRISLDVVGEMPRALRRRLRRHAWVNYLGPAESLAPLLQSYHLGLNVEHFGGGFKLKTLTYIVHGVPVAGLESALTGIPPRLKQQMLVRDSNAELVKAIKGALEDLSALEQSRRMALLIAQKIFSWDATGATFAQHIYRQSVCS